MRKTILILAAAAMGIVMAVVACTNTSAGEDKTAKVDSAARIARGEYLVNSIGCDDCHSPKRMGPNGPEIIEELRLSGFTRSGHLPPVDTNEVKKGWTLFSPDFTAAVGVWGASFAANITSDETGIGNWSEENFLYALRNGKLKGLEGSRDILPPMPWFQYRNMSDEDLKSIYAFLKSTKPVDNVVPAPTPLSDLK